MFGPIVTTIFVAFTALIVIAVGIWIFFSVGAIVGLLAVILGIIVLIMVGGLRRR